MLTGFPKHISAGRQGPSLMMVASVAALTSMPAILKATKLGFFLKQRT